jgi:Na+-transporting methylmalonyl-CoA/oxaloacetate decarboxylase gamma subunit
MFNALINGSDFGKGLFVTLVGMLGVFFVLIVFYLLIKLFSKVIPYKPEETNEQ